jgi:hypothetical protein
MQAVILTHEGIALQVRKLYSKTITIASLRAMEEGKGDKKWYP